MGNCLVTKLKENVNNDNLYGMEEIMIQVKTTTNPDATSQKLKVLNIASDYGNNTFEATIIGDGTFYETYEGSAISGKTVTLSKDKVAVYCSNGDYKIKLSNKYKVGWINGILRFVPQSDLKYSDIVGIEYSKGVSDGFCGIEDWENLYYIELAFVSSFKMNLSEISDKTGLTRLSVRATSTQGNISSLSALTNLTRIVLSDPSLGKSAIYGDIISLSALTKLTYCELSNTNIGGNLEDLIAVWRNTKETGSLSMLLTGTNVKIYGNDITTGTTVIWTADTIACNGHTYNNSGEIID